MTTPDASHYQVFLLRLWRDSAETPWRAIVQDTRTGERHTFPTLWALLVFLEVHTGTSLTASPSQDDD